LATRKPKPLSSDEITRIMITGERLDEAVGRAIRRAVLQHQAFLQIERIIAREDSKARRGTSAKSSQRSARGSARPAKAAGKRR